jgi:peptidoglycan/LPS O-acetylase OafA/YrhL
MTSTTSSLAPPYLKYRADIDGLRALAVILVMSFHAFPAWLKSGFIGVDIFFVISGFLISTIIFEGLERQRFSFIDFYSRRIRRIFPALVCVLAACSAAGWLWLLSDEYRQLGKHTIGGAGFVSNFVLWNESGYFDQNADKKPLLHLWSLGIEEQFYIAWPVLLWLAYRFRYDLVKVTAIVAIVSFIANIVIAKEDNVANFYWPMTSDLGAIDRRDISTDITNAQSN